MSNPQPTARQTWQQISQTPAIVAYFEGVFRRAGIRVEETGEEFTVTHTGTALTFAPGIAPEVDFVVPLKLENVRNLVAHSADGQIDPAESWRIVQTLFTPMTEATLRHPMLTDRRVLRLAGVEEHIHVHLLHPNGGDAATHTLILAGDRWHVSTGLHGAAKRVYHITAEQALNYQRQITQAIRQNTFLGWSQFALWYRRWRGQVSTAG